MNWACNPIPLTVVTKERENEGQKVREGGRDRWREKEREKERDRMRENERSCHCMHIVSVES